MTHHQPNPVLIPPANITAEIARILIAEAAAKSPERAEIVRKIWESYLADETPF